MSLEPVQQVLKSLKQTQWQQEQQFVRLLDTWSQIVGPAVAAQSQPIQITARKVLLVATSSSAWAQNLAFERNRILLKLNTQTQQALTDIRFTTSEWPRRSAKPRRLSVPPPITPVNLMPPHPLPQLKSGSNPSDPTAAFDRWTEAIHQRFQGFPTCPRCQCPTPITELKRWTVCSLCAVRPIEQPIDAPNPSNSP
ncbi:DUF721 domain-containing protein [Acaryochloris sp. IP29b_bin.137]|uniref:DUF721 domain-containing protein n=1 Tax=Acaryochloris sp. IP29b_bin.137 TaxID=2969217 RepID=UPI00260AA64F|nr:DUF721 domain-containing protein [Acaryochloris sp. IP29b_bin.137]